MFSLFTLSQKVQACANSIQNVQLTDAAVGALSAEDPKLAECLVSCFHLDQLGSGLIGDLVAVPTSALPDDPAEALKGLVRTPMVGVTISAPLPNGGWEALVSRLPAHGLQFDETVWYVGRNLQLVPASAESRHVPIVIRVKHPDVAFRPASVSQGKKRSVDDVAKGEGEGSVEDSDNVKRLVQYWFIDDDGVKRSVASKSDYKPRYLLIKGLLRVWPDRLQSRFIHDFNVQFQELWHVLIFDSGVGTYMTAATPVERWFPLARRIRGLPLLQDEHLFRKVLMGHWNLADPARVRLHEVGVDVVPWPHHKEHAAQLAGRRRLVHTLEVLGVALAAIWSAEFKDVFVPFMEVLDACPCVADDYTVVYLASRVEHALSEFVNRVFGSLPKPSELKDAQPPAEWAKVLLKMICAAADTTKWELPPTWKFFAYDGEFVNFFDSKLVQTHETRTGKRKKRGGLKNQTQGTPAVTPVTPVATVTPVDNVRPVKGSDQSATKTKKEKQPSNRVCHLAVAEWLKAKDDSGAALKCKHGPQCKYSHELTAVQALPESGLSALIEAMRQPVQAQVQKVLRSRGDASKQQ